MSERLATRATSMSASAFLVAAAVVAAITMPLTTLVPLIGPGPRPIEIMEKRDPKLPEIEKVRQPPRQIEEALRPITPVEPSQGPPTQTQVEFAPPPSTNGNGSGAATTQVTPADFRVRPDGSAFGRYYPPRAVQRNKQGRVEVTCSVNASGRLVGCVVIAEEPGGWGFGDASIRLAQREFEVRPQTVNGQPTDGGTVTFPIRWRLPD